MPPLCGVNEKMLAEALKSVDELKRNRRLVRDYFVDTIPPILCITCGVRVFVAYDLWVYQRHWQYNRCHLGTVSIESGYQLIELLLSSKVYGADSCLSSLPHYILTSSISWVHHHFISSQTALIYPREQLMINTDNTVANGDSAV